MATIFKLTITIGKGEAAREREITLDPMDVPMGILDDLDGLGDSKDWKSIRPIMQDLFGLTNEEFRSMTAKQFIEVATALRGAVGDATTIPND